EVPQDVGVGIPDVLEAADDGVGGRLEQRPIERIPDLEGQVALQARHVEDRVEAQHVERGEPHRIALVDAELEVHIPPRAAHQRVHHGVHVAALAVQQQQAYDDATELELIEGPL